MSRMFQPTAEQDASGRTLHAGQVHVVRPLTEEEIDLEEVGPMYEVKYLDGPAAGETRHAFADELEP